MSRQVWPELCLILAAFAGAGTSAAQQTSGNAAAEAQAPQPSATVTQQAPPDAAKTESAPTAAATPAAAPTPAPAGPSADLIKQARSTGFKVKGTGAKTRFCKSEAQIGTHIVTENCMNEDQFQSYLQRTEQDRNDMMRMQGGCSAPGCVHN
jgi:hypothetical protein